MDWVNSDYKPSKLQKKNQKRKQQAKDFFEDFAEIVGEEFDDPIKQPPIEAMPILKNPPAIEYDGMGNGY